MALLSSGYIIAGAYANKIRRTLFAQTRDLVKSGDITPQEVARAAGELNRILYEILVNRLKSDKGDVVRVTIEYNIVEKRIVWNYDKLSIQLWRRVPEETLARIVSEVKAIAKELVVRPVQFEVVKVGETEGGDIIYSLVLANKEVGLLLLTPLDESKAVIRGAVIEPTPMLLKRLVIDVEPPVNEFISNNIGVLMGKAAHVELEEADKAIREIRALIEVMRKPQPTILEEEEEF